MVYKNLLLRGKGKSWTRLRFPGKKRLSALAGDWFNRALEARKANAQTGAAGIRQPGAILPPLFSTEALIPVDKEWLVAALKFEDIVGGEM
jgi:hypothetical protein